MIALEIMLRTISESAKFRYALHMVKTAGLAKTAESTYVYPYLFLIL